MQTRYTPWWLPTALIASLLICAALFTALVVQTARLQNGTNTTNIAQQTLGEPVYKWRLITTWPKKFPGLGLAPENFADLVNKMSNGRMQITVYGANELAPALGVFDAVSGGSVEMGHGAAYYWKGKIPASAFFTSVPFGMNAQEFNGWIHYGGGLELWRETYAPHNLIPFAGGNTGVQMGGWFNKEINSLEDISGLKMRIPGYGGEVFSRAGGSAVNIPGGELYTSLQSGVIDATEWVGPYNDLAFGFHQIAKYYYYPGWHEPGPSLEFIIHKPTYEALPEDLQSIIETAARAINQDMLDEYTARNQSALAELLEKHQVELRRFPEDVIAKLRTMSFELYDETAEKDAHFAKVYANYRAFLDNARKAHEISEAAYYEIR